MSSIENSKVIYINPVNNMILNDNDLVSTSSSLEFIDQYSININIDNKDLYSNINNVIPNPLKDNIIYNKYKNKDYATSDLFGYDNTIYLRRNKSNVSNIIGNNYYIPSIGELGIAIENIQTINNSFDTLKDEYKQYKITNDKNFVSSSLKSYNNINIQYKNYKITHGLEDIWYIDTKTAKIAYNSISNNYDLLPFYKLDNNVMTELDMYNYDDINVNSFINTEKNYFLKLNQSDNINYYCEYNNPIDIDQAIRNLGVTGKIDYNYIEIITDNDTVVSDSEYSCILKYNDKYLLTTCFELIDNQNDNTYYNVKILKITDNILKSELYDNNSIIFCDNNTYNLFSLNILYDNYYTYIYEKNDNNTYKFYILYYDKKIYQGNCEIISNDIYDQIDIKQINKYNEDTGSIESTENNYNIKPNDIFYFIETEDLLEKSISGGSENITINTNKYINQIYILTESEEYTNSFYHLENLKFKVINHYGIYNKYKFEAYYNDNEYPYYSGDFIFESDKKITIDDNETIYYYIKIDKQYNIDYVTFNSGNKLFIPIKNFNDNDINKYFKIFNINKYNDYYTYIGSNTTDTTSSYIYKKINSNNDAIKAYNIISKIEENYLSKTNNEKYKYYKLSIDNNDVQIKLNVNDIDISEFKEEQSQLQKYYIEKSNINNWSWRVNLLKESTSSESTESTSSTNNYCVIDENLYMMSIELTKQGVQQKENIIISYTNSEVDDYNDNLDDYIRDFSLKNWLKDPFNSKYFFNFTFNQNLNYLNKYINNNFNYNWNEYVNKNIDINNKIRTNVIGYISNNSVDYLDDNKLNDLYLYYNIPIYDNNIVLSPIYGSGENNYNINKYIPICEFYVAVPKLNNYFNIYIDNCDIYKKIFINLDSFYIYYIRLNFKDHYPISNTIEFKVNYNNNIYSRKYFFTIYSFNISNILSSKNIMSTNLHINNFYVNKNSYFWWDAIDNENRTLNPTYMNGKFCYSYIEISNNDDNKQSYILNDIHRQFIEQSKISFNSCLDLSYLINNISANIKISYNYVNLNGLRVDRIIDKDTIFNNVEKIGKTSNTYNNTYLFTYLNNQEYYNIKTADKSFGLLEQFWWKFNYSSYEYTETAKLSYNYHLLNLTSYIYSNTNNKLFNNIENIKNIDENNNIINTVKYTPNNVLSYFNDISYIGNYMPILRIYRTKDKYGINNDLIFTYLYSSMNNSANYKHCYYFTDDYFDNFHSYNVPVNFYYDVIYENNKYNIIYENIFRLNLPVVGSKQSLCLNMNNYINTLQLFENKSNQYYLYSDYIFIYNNSTSVKKILIDDESLSLVDCKKATFEINPYELKVFYPNNFNYNATYREFNNEIYNIKFYNKSSQDIKFTLLNIGLLNLDINTLLQNNIYIEYSLGYRYICHLHYIYYKSSKILYNDIMQMYNTIMETKSEYNNNYDYYNDLFLENEYIKGTKNDHNKNWKKTMSNIQYSLLFINNINEPINYTIPTGSNLVNIKNRLNVISKLNLDHILNISESDLINEYENYINISIKDYSLNKAGYLIIIN